MIYDDIPDSFTHPQSRFLPLSGKPPEPGKRLTIIGEAIEGILAGHPDADAAHIHTALASAGHRVSLAFAKAVLGQVPADDDFSTYIDGGEH